MCFFVVTVGHSSATATKIFIESMANRYGVDIGALKSRIGGAAKQSCSESTAHETQIESSPHKSHSESSSHKSHIESSPHKSHSESSSHKSRSESTGHKLRIERTSRKTHIEIADRKPPSGCAASKSQELIGRYTIVHCVFRTVN